MEIKFFMDLYGLWSLACKIKNVGKYLLHMESKHSQDVYWHQTIYGIYMYMEYIYIWNIFIYAIHILESKHRQAFVDTSDWSIEHRWLLHCINRSSTKLLSNAWHYHLTYVTQYKWEMLHNFLSLTCFWDPYMVRLTTQVMAWLSNDSPRILRDRRRNKKT